MTEVTAYSLDYTAYQSTKIADYYDRLHESDISTFKDSATGQYVVWRYNDVARALDGSDPAIDNSVSLDPLTPRTEFLANPKAWPHLARLMRNTEPVTANAHNPVHHNVRRAIFDRDDEASFNFAKTQRNYQELVAGQVAKAGEILDSHLATCDRTSFDRAFARPVASRVIGAAIGFSPGEQDHVQRWSDAQTSLLGRMLSKEQQVVALKGLADLSSSCRSLAHAAIALEKHGNPYEQDGHSVANMLASPHNNLTEKQIGSTLMNLMAAGYATTYGTILNSMNFLLSPDGDDYWQELLYMSGQKRAGLVQELIRLETGLVGWKRRTVAEFELSDQTVISKGVGVIALIGAANRDPSVFDDPHAIDIDRMGRHGAKQLSFGQGPHLCVGKELAKLELTTALDYLCEAVPTIKLAQTETEYDPDYLFRTPRFLDITI